MASFNLGKIKGDKGDKGDTGPKGEKGEKGDSGDRGTDGFTPVFSIAQTQTLQGGSDAYVELDSSDVQNPVLKFYIPRGKDGTDSSGDMQSALYDKNQLKTDIYEYAERIAEGSFKKTGGTFIGKVKAYTSGPKDMCVRNISVAQSFPGDAKNGDICILTKKKSSITLKDIDPGSVVLIKEDGALHEYIVFSNDTTYSGKTALLRKKLLNGSVVFDNQSITTYPQSGIDVFLNSVFVNSLDESIRNKLTKVQVDADFYRSVFIASKEEINGFEYFEAESPRALTDSGKSGEYWTRTSVTGSKFYCFDESGFVTSNTTNVRAYLRPMIILPCETYVENANTSSGAGFKITEDSGGIYILENGEWSECEL